MGLIIVTQSSNLPPWLFSTPKKSRGNQVAICQTGRRRDKHIHVGRLSLQRTTSGTMKSSPSIALYRSCQGEEEQRFLQFAWGPLYKWPCFERVNEVITPISGVITVFKTGRSPVFMEIMTKSYRNKQNSC